MAVVRVERRVDRHGHEREHEAHRRCRAWPRPGRTSCRTGRPSGPTAPCRWASADSGLERAAAKLHAASVVGRSRSVKPAAPHRNAASRRPPLRGRPAERPARLRTGRADRPGAGAAYDRRCESSASGHAARQRTGKAGQPGSPSGSDQTWRWAIAVVAIVVIVLFVSSGMFSRSSAKTIRFSAFQQDVTSEPGAHRQLRQHHRSHHGHARRTARATPRPGPLPLPNPVFTELKTADVKYTFSTPTSSALGEILIYLLPVALIIGFFVWMSRRAQGQMSGIMSIGRSRAKVYTAERPRTTFDDVAGYQGVKQEISEVVDFLKSPGRFKEIGARVPKGVLLVGSAGHRQDAAGACRRRRGRSPLPLGERIGLHGDVRRRRREPGP